MGKRRASRIASLLCAVVLTASFGAMTACGDSSANTENEPAANAQWYYGTEIPAENLGNVGDYYLDTESLRAYVRSADGEWLATNLYSGAGAPENADGAKGDLYLDTTGGVLYQKGESLWQVVLKVKGENGRDGVLWFSGEKDPEAEDPTLTDAQAGDFYLNTTEFTVWQLNADGETWRNLGSIKGHGTTWFEGLEAPTAENAAGAYEGDFYFRSAYIDDEAKAEQYSIYRYEKGEWVVKTTVVTADLSAFYGVEGESFLQDNGRNVTVSGVAEGVTDLVVPGELNGKGVAIADNAFESSAVQSVVVDEGVVSVGKNAFKDCTQLTDVTWNAVRCGDEGSSKDSVFAGCSSLKNVTFGGNVKTIPKYGFFGCKNLTTVTFNGNDCLEEIGRYAFSGCSALESIELPESLTVVRNCAFNGCSALTEIKIPANVETIEGSAFFGCNNLVTLTIGGEAGSKLKKVESEAFSGCSNLSRVTLGEGMELIGKSMFKNCTLLQNIIIPESVTSIGESAFYGSGLTEIEIGSGVTSIAQNAFQKCSALASVVIGKSVASIGSNIFDGCASLNALTVDGENVTFKGEGNCIIEKGTDVLIVGCAGSSIPDGVKTIGAKAFYNAAIASVTIPASVTEIGENAFQNCASLTTLNFAPEGSQLTKIGKSAFDGCNQLSGSIVLPESVKELGGSAFKSCEGITSVTLGNRVTSIGSYTFSGCSALAEITLGDSIETIDIYAFANTLITSITLPASVKSIANRAFNSSQINSITFGGAQEVFEALLQTENFLESRASVEVTFAGGEKVTYANGVKQ